MDLIPRPLARPLEHELAAPPVPSPLPLARLFPVPLAIRAEPAGAQGYRLVLSGSLNRRNAAQLKHAARAAMAALTASGAEAPSMQLDLHDLRHLDSSGLAALVAVSEEARRRGATLRVVGASQAARRLIARAGLHQILEFEDA